MNSPATRRDIQVTLDGQRVDLPAERRSLTAIRAYLEALAMEQQRILCAFCVDGRPANLAHFPADRNGFTHVAAETVDLDDLPRQLIRTALHQTVQAREQALAAVVLVLINEGVVAREFWWKLAADLKAPLLTLSLVPESVCGPANGSASLTQLRKWQLQQLAGIIREVDEACWTEDPNCLSNTLENRVLPWLDKLHESLDLWHKTALAGAGVLCGAI
ncbi:MAG: hypothetical protein KIS67_17625 [Verrucomicrobiae bacterium]|nr:hypothetical protein [Verrucomicrobiae bacterium]